MHASPSLSIDVENSDINLTLERYFKAQNITICNEHQNSSHRLCCDKSRWQLFEHESLFQSVAMPTRLSTLHSIIRSAFDEYEQSHSNQLSISGKLMLHCTRRYIMDINQNICLELTQKETELLAAIIASGKEGADKDMLLEKVWGYHPETESRTLETHLYRLRQKLAELPNHHIEINADGGTHTLRTG